MDQGEGVRLSSPLKLSCPLSVSSRTWLPVQTAAFVRGKEGDVAAQPRPPAVLLAAAVLRCWGCPS